MSNDRRTAIVTGAARGIGAAVASRLAADGRDGSANGRVVRAAQGICAAADIPVRRVGQPSDIAAAVAFFASEEASFVSGQVLYIAGGPRC